MSLFPIIAPVAAALLPTTDLVHHWHTGAGVTESGGLVSQWDDQVGSHDLAEATNKPALSAGALNGYDTIIFDGSNDKLVSSAGTIGQLMHCFAAMKQVTWSNGAVAFMGATDASPYNIEVLQSSSPGNPYMAVDSGARLGEVSMTLDTFYLLIWYVPASGTTGSIALNDGTPDTNGGSATRSFNGGLSMGAKPGGTNPCNIEIAELAIYDAEQTSTALSDIKTYFNDKYALW